MTPQNLVLRFEALAPDLHQELGFEKKIQTNVAEKGECPQKTNSKGCSGDATCLESMAVCISR